MRTSTLRNCTLRTSTLRTSTLRTSTLQTSTSRTSTATTCTLRAVYQYQYLTFRVLIPVPHLTSPHVTFSSTSTPRDSYQKPVPHVASTYQWQYLTWRLHTNDSTSRGVYLPMTVPHGASTYQWQYLTYSLPVLLPHVPSASTSTSTPRTVYLVDGAEGRNLRPVLPQLIVPARQVLVRHLAGAIENQDGGVGLEERGGR